MSGIQADLKDGNKFEDYILSYIKQKYPKAFRKEGYFPDYDIEVPEIEDTVECKFDRMSQKTGNLAIEFEYNKKPSGINHTTATRWAIGYWNKAENCWKHAFIRTEILRKACEGKRTVKGGDRWASNMYLFPVTDFEKLKEAKIFKSE